MERYSVAHKQSSFFIGWPRIFDSSVRCVRWNPMTAESGLEMQENRTRQITINAPGRTLSRNGANLEQASRRTASASMALLRALHQVRTILGGGFGREAWLALSPRSG